MKSLSKNIIMGISMRLDGKMKFVDESLDEKVTINRESFFQKQMLDNKSVVSAFQTHSKNVKKVAVDDKGKFIDNCDGLITNEKGIILSVTAADCLPIYFYDEVKQVVGVVHAGWKGVLLNIAKETVVQMIKNYDSNPSDIFVYVGPHIQKCHFEVSYEDIDKYKDHKYAIIKERGQYFVDLKGIVENQLIDVNVKKEQIEISKKCTFCEQQDYFSFRRDKPQLVEAQIAYIGLKTSRN